MKIGFYIQWSKGSLNSRGNVLGDELFAESMCKTLLQFQGIESCELFAPNYLPKHKLDVMIYLNDVKPNNRWAAKHLLYLQNAYGEGSDKALARFQQIGYDGYIFVSNKLCNMQKQKGCPAIFLPFGVDVNMFQPHKKSLRYDYDVSYIGNDIKGEKRTLLYLYPAVDYNFGLYGNWMPSLRQKLLFKRLPYQKKFASISKGKILQNEIPLLYSSAKINLNCTAQDCVDWDVITLRTYEVLACKGFLITDIVPVAERELKDCVIFTNGGDDLKEKIEYYLARPEERERIAHNGYHYVIENATITARMKTLNAFLRKIL
ncbi:MAG: glycosyltransferase [Nitrospiraceae bacterium]|nr:glycosyltransferase [Nitrospiraceae bacterium]